MRDNAFSASLPQNGSEEAERHSVAGKEAEKAESMPQNEAQGSESHSVAMLAVAAATIGKEPGGRGAEALVSRICCRGQIWLGRYYWIGVPT